MEPCVDVDTVLPLAPWPTVAVYPVAHLASHPMVVPLHSLAGYPVWPVSSPVNSPPTDVTTPSVTDARWPPGYVLTAAEILAASLLAAATASTVPALPEQVAAEPFAAVPLVTLLDPVVP